MESIKEELSIFEKFGFERPPVGIKYSKKKPEGITKLEKILDFCEMLKEAQEDDAFYATKEEFTCLGPMLLGMTEGDPIFESGMIGPELEIFKEARANRRLYQNIPRLAKDTVDYVMFAPMDKMSFEPDVLVITANVTQAETILRANSYNDGKMFSTKGTVVIACAWLFVYPFVSGELNFLVTGIGFGMRARQLFPEGLVLLSIPWDLIPGIVSNLKEMAWVPHSYTIGREAHKAKVKRIVESLK